MTDKIDHIAFAEIIGKTKTNKPILKIKDLFQPACNQEGKEDLASTEGFILSPTPKAYKRHDRYVPPTLYDADSTENLPDYETGSVLIAIAFAPTGKNDEETNLPLAHAITRYTLTPKPFIKTKTEDLQDLLLPLLVPPGDNESMMAEIIRLSETLIPDITKRTYKIECEQKFDYEYDARKSQFEPNSAIFHFWKNPNDPDGKNLSSHVLCHSGSFFFYTQENGTSAEDMSVENPPTEPGIWRMTNGKSWSDPDPEFCDMGIDGSWEKLPENLETATLLGYESIKAMQDDLQEQIE